jgi:hypothetical protein
VGVLIEKADAEDGEVDEEGEVTELIEETQKEFLNELSKRRVELSQQGMALVQALKVFAANIDRFRESAVRCGSSSNISPSNASTQ